jgi:hypothetical protein
MGIHFLQGGKMEKRFAALRIVGTVYKVLVAVIAVITVVSIIGLCGTSIIGGTALDAFVNEYGNTSGGTGIISGAIGGIIISVAALIYGGITSITLFAFGEAVYLLIAMEENTRQTAMLLRQKS